MTEYEHSEEELDIVAAIDRDIRYLENIKAQILAGKYTPEDAKGDVDWYWSEDRAYDLIREYAEELEVEF